MSVTLAIAVLSWIGPLIIWPRVGKNVPPQYTNLLCYPHYSRIKPLAIAANLYIAWLPLLLICIMYLRVFRILRERATIVQEHKDQTYGVTNRTSQQKMTTISATIEKRNLPITRFHDVENGTMEESGIDNPGLEMEGNSDSLDVANKEYQNTSRREITTAEMKARYKIDQQNIKATRVLTFIVAVMIVTRLPWSILSVVQIICGPACGVPLNLYQVRRILK